jgi:hypothetical protein
VSSSTTFENLFAACFFSAAIFFQFVCAATTTTCVLSKGTRGAAAAFAGDGHD